MGTGQEGCGALTEHLRRAKRMSARKIAIRMGTVGAENGLAPIRTIGVGDQIDQHFERTGETIWSDGYDWHYSSHA
jgi:hypothetical protein